MFWDTKTRERIDAQNVNLRQVEFETHSCHYGHSVQCIWPTRTGPSLTHDSINGHKSSLGREVKSVDSDLLNCVAWSNNDAVIATGDDKSLIRLYDYPVTNADGHCEISISIYLSLYLSISLSLYLSLTPPPPFPPHR